jgi:hypothetical protein
MLASWAECRDIPTFFHPVSDKELRSFVRRPSLISKIKLQIAEFQGWMGYQKESFLDFMYGVRLAFRGTHPSLSLSIVAMMVKVAGCLVIAVGSIIAFVVIAGGAR